MLGQQGHWIRLISSQKGSQPCLRPAAASSGLRALLPVCKSSSSSDTGSEGASRRRTRQPRGRSKGAADQVQSNTAPDPLPAPDIASNAAAPAPPLDAANSAAADARTAAAAQSLSELVAVPSGPRLEFPDAPFKLRPYQVSASIHQLHKQPQLHWSHMPQDCVELLSVLPTHSLRSRTCAAVPSSPLPPPTPLPASPLPRAG